jgi:apolipoprotein N-acyltransferase
MTSAEVLERRSAHNTLNAVWAWFQRIHGRVYQLSGWRRTAVVMLLGCVSVLALPPLHIIPALIPAFVGLVWLVAATKTWRGAFWVGWCFGFGYYCAGLYWIANALLTKPEEFGAFVPFAVGGLSALLAVFVALTTVLAFMTRATGVLLVLAMAGGWAISEWLRSFVLTGFPWNLIASVWVSTDSVLQISAVIGPFGLGLITVVAAAMPAALLPRREGVRIGLTAVLLAFLCVAGTAIYGAVRLHQAGAPHYVDGVRLRLVQPNIPQQLKWKPDLRIKHVEDQIELGATDTAVRPTHVIWSEVAAPLFLAQHPSLLSAVGAGTPDGGLTILGTLRRTPADKPFELWNSLIAINPAGQPVATYDKAHLVPFGEYVPFRSIIDIPSITGGTDFTPGVGPQTLRIPGTPSFSPLICYEVIFPGAVVDSSDRPEWILNITNDAWYGYSAGPFQHFAAARMRAVEEGLPLVRVANTGVSAIVDPYGRIVERLGLSERGIVDGPLPRALQKETLYGRYGNILFLVIAVILLLLARMGTRKLDV